MTIGASAGILDDPLRRTRDGSVAGPPGIPGLGHLLLALGLLACDGEATERDAAVTDAAADRRDAAAVEDASTGDDAGPAGGWRDEPALPLPVQEIAVVAHGGRIWLAGGFEGGDIVPTVRVFDPADGSWSEGPALPAPRHHMSLVSHGGDLYALGGMQTLRFEPLDTAWVLRAGADGWEPIASLPRDRGAAAAGAVGDRIVLAGGNGRRGTLAAETLLYDPVADAWTLGAAIPTEREHLAAEPFEGELWVFGGRENSLSTNRVEVEIYDPVADAWRDGPTMPTARGGFDVALLDGAVYAVGGEEPARALDSVDRLELAAGTWSAAPPVPTPRHGHGVVALAGRLWVIGGGDAPNFAPVDVVESYEP
ncbi:MAG TPA: kelch repeat-containing protein [Sandaracinaceae bacterium LLY-WYZ-13_1]|nr:kelch repeat-containing protein [Sandaracinaceae bacterium LLY-WYZ-13_1]